MGTASRPWDSDQREDWEKKKAEEAAKAGTVPDKPPGLILPGTYTDGGADRKEDPYAGIGTRVEIGDTRKDPYYGKDAVENDVATSRMQRDRLLSQYETAQPRAVPTTTAPTIAAVTPTAGTTVGTAAQAGPVNVGPATRVGAIPTVTAGQVGHTQIGPVDTISAARVAPVANASAAQATAAPVTAATLDQSQQQQLRQRQMSLLDSIERGGPSAAEATLRKATDEAIATQAGSVAAARGTGRAGAQWQAANQIAGIQGRAGADAAILRAGEEQKRRDQLLQGYEGTRGADIGVASTQAGFQQQANITGAQLQTGVSQSNASNQTNVSLANASAENVRGLKQADLEQAAAAGNQSAINEMRTRQAQLNQTADITTAQLGLDAAKANQGAAVTTGVADADAANRMAQLQAQINSQQGIANSAQQNELAKLQAQIDAQRNIVDSTATNDAAREQARIQLSTNVANLDAELRSRGLDDAQRKMQLDAYIEQQAQALGWDKNEAALEVARSSANKELAGGILKGIVTVGAAALSDRRAKTDITPLYSDERGKTGKKALLDHYDDGGGGGKDEVADLLDKIHPVKFKYKDPGADGAAKGERFGIIAQDLEKSPMGASLVIDDGGVKKIDTGQAVGALLAAMARMNTRVKRVEGRR